MTLAQINLANAQKQELDKEVKDLRELKRFYIGKPLIGERPDLVARAIKFGIPIPLKYTHSYLGLQALYKYSVDTADPELFQWVSTQIVNQLSVSVRNQFRQENASNPVFGMKLNKTRLEFLANLKTMDVGKLNEFLVKDKLPPFVKFNIERIRNINCIRRTNVQQTTQVKSMYGILVEQFQNEVRIRKDSPEHPKRLVSTYTISSQTYFPALVEALASGQRWRSMIDHELFGEKKLMKLTTTVPLETALKLIESYQAPEIYLNEIQGKFK